QIVHTARAQLAPRHDLSRRVMTCSDARTEEGAGSTPQQGPQPQTARQPDLARRNEQNSDGQARTGPEMRQVIVMVKFA
ncbi:MAG: hypothetical protein NTW00_14475, partial [Hyphomicrobiales bacterium]|nr:hypothetical protein [Hyphomicrobiales bacterium]